MRDDIVSCVSVIIKLKQTTITCENRQYDEIQQLSPFPRSVKVYLSTSLELLIYNTTVLWRHKTIKRLEIVASQEAG